MTKTKRRKLPIEPRRTRALKRARAGSGTKGQHSLRATFDYLKFLERQSKHYIEEQRLQTFRPTKFLYLLDFQEIYDAISPFLSQQQFRHRTPSNHHSARQFFELTEAKYVIPLGASAELLKFLQFTQRSIGKLARITHTTSIEAASNALKDFIGKEEFLGTSPATWSSIIEGAASNKDMVSLQIDAVRSLMSLETGLSRLLAILTDEKHERLDLDEGFRFNKGYYELATAEISRDRRRKDRVFGNQVDAFNLALVCAINDFYDRSPVIEGESETTFCKLVTDTNVILQLARARKLKLHLMFSDFHGSGIDINVLERCETVVAKSLFQSYQEERGRQAFSDFVRMLGVATDALSAIQEAATLEDEDVLDVLKSLLDPRTNRDRQRIIGLHRQIEDLDTFFLQRRDALAPLEAAQARQQLLPIGPDSMPSSLAAASLARLENLVSSIMRVLREISPVQEELSPLQSGDDSLTWSNPLLVHNPVLSLERLGYEQVGRSVGKKTIWTLVERSDLQRKIQQDEVREVLRIVHHPEVSTTSWPSAEGISVLMPRVLKVLFDSKILASTEEEVTMMTISSSRERRVSRIPILEVEQLGSSDEDIAFLRLDLPGHALVFELFSVDEDYTLRTALISEHLDIDLSGKFFLELALEGANPLFRRVIEQSLRNLVRAHISLEV